MLFQVLTEDVTLFAHKRNIAVWRGVTMGNVKGHATPKGQKIRGGSAQRPALVRRLSENFGLWQSNSSVLDVGVTKYSQGAREMLVGAGFVPVDTAQNFHLLSN